MVDPSADGLLNCMHYVYVLQNKKRNKIYIGQTSNLEKRIRQHNDLGFDKRSFTKLNKGKWLLVYKEDFETRTEVMKREKELKSSRGRDFIRTKILKEKGR